MYIVYTEYRVQRYSICTQITQSTEYRGTQYAHSLHRVQNTEILNMYSQSTEVLRMYTVYTEYRVQRY